MLLNYFDPTFFNKLEYHTQQLCADPDMIAISMNEKAWFTHLMEEHLTDEDFTKCYSATVVTRYKFAQTEANIQMEVTNF